MNKSTEKKDRFAPMLIFTIPKSWNRMRRADFDGELLEIASQLYEKYKLKEKVSLSDYYVRMRNERAIGREEAKQAHTASLIEMIEKITIDIPKIQNKHYMIHPDDLEEYLQTLKDQLKEGNK